jgi:hypothetical protein
MLQPKRQLIGHEHQLQEYALLFVSVVFEPTREASALVEPSKLSHNLSLRIDVP